MDLSAVLVIVFACLAAILTSVEACSQPLGWKSKRLLELVEEAKLVVYGEFLDITNSTSAQNAMITDVRINTAVYCVLKNTDNVDVPATLIIEEMDSVLLGKCVNNLYNIKTAVKLIIFLTKLDQGNNFGFSNVNVQSAKHKVDEEKLSEIVCIVDDLKQPIGASPDAEFSCPAVTCSEAHKSTLAISALLLPLLIVFQLH